MNWKTIVLGVIGVIFVGAIIYSLNEFIPSIEEMNGIKEEGNSGSEGKLMIEVKESIGAGEGLNARAEARDEKGLKEIIYESVNKEEIIECSNQKHCVGEFSDSFMKKGIYQLKFTSINSLGEKMEEKKKLMVLDEGKKCLDGTAFNQCSEDKPVYCEEGKLVNKCSECGCVSGHECLSSGECKGETVELEISEVKAEREYVKPDAPVNLIIELKNGAGKTALKGTAYLLYLVFSSEGNEKENTYNFSLEKEVENGGIIEAEVREFNNSGKGFSLEEGSYSIEVKLFDAASSVCCAEAMSEHFEQEFITVKEDSIAPNAPKGLKAEISGNKIELKWSRNSEEDLQEYRLYESNNVTAAYIMYSLKETIPKEKNNTETGYEEGKEYYFVLTAVDYYGNESDYSGVVKAG